MDFRNYPIIMKKFRNEFGEEITQIVTEEKKQIVNRHVVLEGIPHPYKTIKINTDCVWVNKFKEIPLSQEIKNVDEMKIDWTQGKIWFSHKLEGETVDLEYNSIGYTLLHTSRIYTQASDSGEVIETLDDIITYNAEAIKVLGDLADAIKVVDRVNDLERKVAELESYIKSLHNKP